MPPVQAWLERLNPKGDPIALPDGRATIVFGRSRKATLVFDDPLVSPRHVELTHDGTFWRARDLGTQTGTRVNRTVISYPRALFHGDVLEFGATRLRFKARQPPDNDDLRAVIARDPERADPYLVYADWLLERGDPLGDRIIRAHRGELQLDLPPWLGPLWDLFIHGELELEFHLGFVRRAVIRRVAGHLPPAWLGTAATLVASRLGQFLRVLEIDVPAFVPHANETLAKVLEAQAALAALPALPLTLHRLCLGYQLRPGDPSALPASAELEARVPALGGTDVFLFPGKARLRLLTLNEGQRVVGVEDGVRALHDVTRVRRTTRSQLNLETPPGIPFIAGGNPCFLSIENGRWRLSAGRLKGEVRVNGRVDTSWLLLPGDVISLQGVGSFRFEVAA